MAQKPQLAIIDPNHVPDTLCDGPANATIHPPLATIVFTNSQPKPGPLFQGTIDVENIVVARITMSVDTLIGLRELLNQVIANHEADQQATMIASSGHKH